MTGHVDTERILDAFLAPEADRLADRVIDAALLDIDRTRQRRALRVPWRFPHMPALSRATGIAAVALVAVVGAGGITYFAAGGPGPTSTLPPSPTPTAAPTVAPTVAPTPAHVPGGANMAPGTYFAHPLPTPGDGLTVTFTVPKGWFGFGDGTVFPGDTHAPGGVAFQFLDVTSLQGDPCHWQGPDGDVTVGTTVDELVAALVAQTAYEVSDPIDVSIGGYSGKRVNIVLPAKLFDGTGSSAPDCDEGVARLWSTSSHGEIGIYWQAPDERWQANILDVDGTRFVVVVQDSPQTSPAGRAEGEAILESMVIEP